MAYSVTGIRATPDIGFRFEHRHTAEGARELATAYLAEGLREIEVRDHCGNLRSVSDLEQTTVESGSDERDLAERMASFV